MLRRAAPPCFLFASIGLFAGQCKNDVSRGNPGGDKKYVREDLADAREAYEAALRTLTDPHAAAEEQAGAARHAMNYADWARYRLEDFGAAGSEARQAREALTDIIEDLRPYADGVSSEWTGGANYANIASRDWPEPQESFRLPDEIIGRSVGAKSQNYDILDLSTGEVYHLVEGSHLQNIEVFAGKGTKTEFRDAYKYAVRYGGAVDAWQHAKGIGIINAPDGDIRAEIHWIQCEGIGRREMFVKEWLE